MMIYKRVAGVLGALALTTGAALALASPAHADDEPHLPVAPWAANGESHVVDATTVILQDHATGDTSIENPSVGINVQAGAEITVSYKLVDDEAGAATCQSGEPRLFAITNGTLDKSDLCDGPGDPATSGQLTLQTSSAGLVTQVGLVYSRATGHVVMTDLTVDGTLVLFAEPPEPPEPCEWDAELLAEDEECQEPAATPSPSPSATASSDPSPAAGQAGGSDDADRLPETGSPIPGIVLIGLLLVGAGALALWVTRRRSGPLITIPE